MNNLVLRLKKKRKKSNKNRAHNLVQSFLFQLRGFAKIKPQNSQTHRSSSTHLLSLRQLWLPLHRCHSVLISKSSTGLNYCNRVVGKHWSSATHQHSSCLPSLASNKAQNRFQNLNNHIQFKALYGLLHAYMTKLLNIWSGPFICSHFKAIGEHAFAVAAP